MSNELEKIFEIEPEEDKQRAEYKKLFGVNPVVIEDGVDEDVDHNAARTNYYELIEQGKAAVSTAMMVAEQSQNPRALEVLGNLIKTMADVNKQLVNLNKDKADIKNAKMNRTSGPQQPALTNNIENAVFVGNSSDLNKMLANKKLNEEK